MRRLAASSPASSGTIQWRRFARGARAPDRAFAPARRLPVGLPRTRQGLPPSAFYVLLVALVARITIGAPLLYDLHIDYASDGGNPLMKIHIGAYVTMLAMWLWLREGREPLPKLIRHYHDRPGIFAFMVAMLVCLAYSVANHLSGFLSTFADSFLSAGMVATLLTFASPRQRAVVGQVLVLTLCLNAAIAAGETLAQRPLIPPIPVNGDIPVETEAEFRGGGLSSASLEGAMLTMMAIFLLFRLRLPTRAVIWRFIVLELGLIGFGGRVALVTTSAVLAVAGVAYVLRELATRRLRAEVLGAALILAFALPAALLVLVAATPIGARIANNFYFDGSAEVRSMVWNIFSVIPLQNLMFGTPDQLQLDLAERIGIPVLQGDFENPWLVLIVSLGLVGFAIFMLGFVPFLLHLWRRAGEGRESALWGRLIIITFLVVGSTSNSFGRKGPLLVILTAAIYAGVPVARRSAALARRRLRLPNAHFAPNRLRPAGAFLRSPRDMRDGRDRAFRRPAGMSLQGGGR